MLRERLESYRPVRNIRRQVLRTGPVSGGVTIDTEEGVRGRACDGESLEKERGKHRDKEDLPPLREKRGDRWVI